MAGPKLDNVISHWQKPFADFQTSPLEFYEAVEAATGRKEIPGLSFSRIDYTEGGAHTPNREYLRISRDRLIFDVCAAPFGTGFFFSWWLTERRNRWALLLMLALMLGIYFLLNVGPVQELEWRAAQALPFFLQAVAGPLFMVVKALLWVLALLFIGRLGGTLVEDAVLSIPLVGWLYQRLFRRLTYYRIDTIIAFQSMVHASVMEVLDGLLYTKGIRLSDEEKKPVFRDFLARP